MADDKLLQPDGTLPGEPPSKSVPGFSQDAIHVGLRIGPLSVDRESLPELGRF
jgi:hypothetical protein